MQATSCMYSDANNNGEINECIKVGKNNLK